MAKDVDLTKKVSDATPDEAKETKASKSREGRPGRSKKKKKGIAHRHSAGNILKHLDQSGSRHPESKDPQTGKKGQEKIFQHIKI